MSVRERVAKYIAAGCAVLRLPKGEKASTERWQKKTYTEADFSDDDNIAIKCGEPSGHRVCLDLDCAQAVALADEFLPDTGLIEGRISKPRSHRWFTCPGAKTEKFQDVDDAKTCLGEIRSTGAYVVVPDSLHDSGETRAWESEGEAKLADYIDLRIGFVHLMISAIIARHWWPGDGADTPQHDTAGALAGFLLQQGVHPTYVPRILDKAFTHAGDADVPDRMRYVRDTIARFEAGEKIFGGPTVATTLGAALVDRIRLWLRKSNTDVITELNQDWFICDVGPETVVGNEIEETDLHKTRKWTRFQFRTFADFKRRLIKSPQVMTGFDKDGQPVMRDLPDYWLEHSQGRQYHRLVYAPDGSGVTVDPKDLNGWKGFTVPPAPGDWAPIKQFILDVICCGDTRLLHWTLNWCASLFQQPGQHGETGLVLIGPQGAGKNFFLEQVLAWCFDGRHSATVVGNVDAVLGSFNDRLSGLVLLILDEVHLTTAQSAALRGIVTSDSLDINRKNIARATERSMLHFGLASNEDVALQLNRDDRRFAVYRVSEAHANDHDYFAGLAKCLRDGGRAAMLHDLMHHQIDANALRLAPATTAKDEMRLGGLKQQDTALLDWLLDRGTFNARVAKFILHDALRGKKHERTDPGWSDVALGRLMKRIFPNLTAQKIQLCSDAGQDAEPVNAYDFGGDLADCRRAFEEYARVSIDWESGAVIPRTTAWEKKTEWRR